MPGWAHPSNLSELIRDNLGLRLTCKCGHTADPDVRQLRDALKKQGGYREELADLPRHLRCSKCGEKALSYTTFPLA